MTTEYPSLSSCFTAPSDIFFIYIFSPNFSGFFVLLLKHYRYCSALWSPFTFTGKSLFVFVFVFLFSARSSTFLLWRICFAFLFSLFQRAHLVVIGGWFLFVCLILWICDFRERLRRCVKRRTETAKRKKVY